MSNLKTKEQGRVMEEQEKETVDAYFDDKLEKAEVTKEANGDYTLQTTSGRFVRLSGEKSLEDAVAEHNELNKPLAERVAEMEAQRKKAASEEPQLTEEAKKRLAEEKTEE
jgi:hypothetical protein